MIVLAILSPFLAAPVAWWLAARRPAAAGLLALWPAALTVVFADVFGSVLLGEPRVVEIAWAPSLGLSLSFHLDGLGLLFALLIAGIGTLVFAYAAAYLGGHAHLGRFYGALFAFMGAMLGVVLSDNLFTLFVFWELTGFTSFLLIGFETEREHARNAAIQALIVTGAGGLALLAGAILLRGVSGTASLAAMLDAPPVPASDVLYTPIVILVLLAAFTKSAQVPFHFWLPSAMAAPTPVSAYLHSATMVKAGVYLVARLTPILGGTPLWTGTIVAVGAVTMTIGAWRAVRVTDLKRVLAYSTVSALGVLMLLLGFGTRAGVVAALVYLIAHAGYKGALFLTAGAVEHETGTRDVTLLGGLRGTMPFTAAAGGLAAASMLGVPLFLGFVAKEALYESVVEHGDWALVVLVVAVLSSALLGAAALIAGVSPFVRGRGEVTAAHEASPGLWFPPLLLAVAGLMTGLAPAALERPLGAAADGVLGEPGVVELSAWHGVTPVLLLSGLTLGIAGALYAIRVPIRRWAWPSPFDAERLYTGTLAALDRVSRVAAPSLHSASLRSYLMVIMLTAGILVGLSLVAGAPGHTYGIATEPAVHDVLIVALIVCGALSAARATSSMVAVLSLGTVGYGVALMFLAFGAPDLAMTQFSVETLTVVIFVLVFRHFPRFGSLSSPLVRTRDVLVASVFGSLVAALVLFAGSSGVTSRVAGYFVETAPSLAHGRNIVNVILVDFRAFDTLGEITVLATAAIGVHALLRLTTGKDARL